MNRVKKKKHESYHKMFPYGQLAREAFKALGILKNIIRSTALSSHEHAAILYESKFLSKFDDRLHPRHLVILHCTVTCKYIKRSTK